MANGEEDLKEKNRNREKTISNSDYRKWSKLGKDDLEMLIEKSYNKNKKSKRKWYSEE